MKMAVTAAISRFRDALVDPLFGRCNYFLIVETDDMSFEVVENEYARLGENIGMESALALVEIVYVQTVRTSFPMRQAFHAIK